jgi:hypothetical protein
VDVPRAEDDRLATIGGWAAIASAVAAIIYSLAFVAADFSSDSSIGPALTATYSLALMTGGVLSLVALVAVYERIGVLGGGLALLGLVFAILGAAGAIIHGGYDLANALHPPTSAPDASLPFPVDPRGLLTFGASGIGVLALSTAALRSAALPRRIGRLGQVLGVLLLLVYLGRLIVLDPKSVLILLPAALAGVIVSPAWYVLVGRELLRVGRNADQPT